jgi:hypothetical protein
VFCPLKPPVRQVRFEALPDAASSGSGQNPKKQPIKLNNDDISGNNHHNDEVAAASKVTRAKIAVFTATLLPKFRSKRTFAPVLLIRFEAPKSHANSGWSNVFS